MISKKILKEFWVKYPDCEQQLKSWHLEASSSNWLNSNEVKKSYPSASILKDNRIVFNIKGNKYRLIVRITYEFQIIWVRFVGTHDEYNKINANKI